MRETLNHLLFFFTHIFFVWSFILFCSHSFCWLCVVSFRSVPFRSILAFFHVVRSKRFICFIWLDFPVFIWFSLSNIKCDKLDRTCLIRIQICVNSQYSRNNKYSTRQYCIQIHTYNIFRSVRAEYPCGVWSYEKNPQCLGKRFIVQPHHQRSSLKFWRHYNAI